MINGVECAVRCRLGVAIGELCSWQHPPWQSTVAAASDHQSIMSTVFVTATKLRHLRNACIAQRLPATQKSASSTLQQLHASCNKTEKSTKIIYIYAIYIHSDLCSVSVQRWCPLCACHRKCCLPRSPTDCAPSHTHTHTSTTATKPCHGTRRCVFKRCAAENSLHSIFDRSPVKTKVNSSRSVIVNTRTTATI